MSFREPNGAVMTNMKPKDGASIEAPSLRGLQGRSATGLNGQAAKDEVSAVWQGGWMPENISGVPAGRSIFHLTSPLIGLLEQIERQAVGCIRLRSQLLDVRQVGRDLGIQTESVTGFPRRFLDLRHSVLEPHLCTDLNGWRNAEGVNPLGPLEIL